MKHMIQIEPLAATHIPEIKKLWDVQYTRMAQSYHFLPHGWLGNSAAFATFIERHPHGLAVASAGRIVGYMAYDLFDFHGERTAFFPIMAHAAEEECKLEAYALMYRHLAQRLVEQGCINHLLSFFPPDQPLQRYLFELGFGLYVVDAFRGLDDIAVAPEAGTVNVRQAGMADLDALSALVKESDGYYAEPPLFLMREAEGRDEIAPMLAAEDNALFLAFADSRAVGFMNVRVNHRDDPITLCDPTTACLDPLGAYIRQEYRGAGIGKRLLREVIAWARRMGAQTLHVDFESANPHASRFWPRYFAPAIYSLKRHLNEDVLR
jgi:GNAT superfamily N-acetyltransferase